ncbi:MAG: hypothetical protein WCS96_03220 [Victivallales bacterium]
MLEYCPRYAYVNDFTLIQKDGVFHLFHITGERKKYSCGLVDAKDHVGHAVSTNLVNWDEQPVVKGLSGACFCIRHSGRYAIMCRVNKISWSDDLLDWSEPATVNYNYDEWKEVYETPEARNIEKGVYFSPRDPFVWHDELNNRFLMFFCTRVSYGEIFTRGCVGLAESKDLSNWKLLPPAFGPGLHFYPESPHVVDLNGKYHMFYHLSSEYGLRHAVSEKLEGPYEELENMDILPGYIGASETLKVDGKWYFLGRMLERTEYANKNRLCQKSLSLPLLLETGSNDQVIFKALPVLKDFRGECLFCSGRNKINEFWRVESGDWRINKSPAMAANQHQPIPENSFFGSANFMPGMASLNQPCRNLDMEFDLQIPSFNGNDCHQRGGFMFDGITFNLDLFQKALFCQDADRNILAFKVLPYVKNDRYYHFRVFRNDNMTQIFMDDELLMYLPAYSDGNGRIAFVVDHGDVIIKDVSIWRLKTEDYRGFTPDDAQGRIMNGIVY